MQKGLEEELIQSEQCKMKLRFVPMPFLILKSVLDNLKIWLSNRYLFIFEYYFLWC